MAEEAQEAKMRKRLKRLDIRKMVDSCPVGDVLSGVEVGTRLVTIP